MAATMEGPLSKWTNVMKGWQYRWFVLDGNQALLTYYTSKEKMMRGSRRGCVRLKDAIIGIDDEDNSTFTITVDQKTFHFQARDGEERERWIQALENTVRKHIQPIKTTEPDNAHSMADFDRKLAEADAYLQILIDQVDKLEDRFRDCDDMMTKERCNIIKITAQAMVEAVKHSMVMLQIAKEQLTGNAFIGVSNPEQWFAPPPDDDTGMTAFGLLKKETDGSDKETSQQTCDPSSTRSPVLSKATSPKRSSKVSIETSTSGAPGSLTRDNDNVANSKDLSLPVIAADEDSSSEDESFFDAEEYESKTRNSITSLDEARKKGETTDSNPIIADENDYFDELYDIRDNSNVDLEGQGSIIKYLLSQVRIGMDLTKVVLPTFILERRSTLEMFADFLAHPDLFVKVADMKTPQERMEQVVRWYLSAFHAGRNADVAKKPYNPILGETFQCYWKIPTESPSRTAAAAKAEPSPNGPVPWATKDNVVFMAEQVSHHPPISAFYAEHFNKRISVDGYIWTKSKFLGLSIGVHMIGETVLSVLDHDEHYVLSFPNGYGRSILTVPWVELGGTINISCAKTGYYANIVFHTKPFYGGKKHRITAEIFAPNERKPFCNVEGEWNGVMFAKYESGVNDIFIHTKTLPIIKKQLLPREQQGEFESRRLWQEVTYHLKNNDVEMATEYKHKLEQRQREEAKVRKENNEKVQNIHFHQLAEGWAYNTPLVMRLKQTATLRKQEQQEQQLLPQQQQEQVMTISVSADQIAVTNSHDHLPISQSAGQLSSVECSSTSEAQDVFDECLDRNASPDRIS